MGEDKKKKQSDIWDSLRVPDVVKQRIDVVKKQSKFWIKLRIRIKKLIPVIIIAGVAIFLWNNSIALQLFVGLLQFVGQLLFAVFFMIVQFGSCSGLCPDQRLNEYDQKILRLLHLMTIGDSLDLRDWFASG